jgi:hypothetical protein
MHNAIDVLDKMQALDRAGNGRNHDPAMCCDRLSSRLSKEEKLYTMKRINNN